MEVFRVCFCSCVNLPFLVWKFCDQVFLDDWEQTYMNRVKWRV